MKSLIKCTQFDLGLGREKDDPPHSESFATPKTPSRSKCSTYFLNISSCNFGTGYGRENIGFASSFNVNSTGYFFQVPSVPSNNY